MGGIEIQDSTISWKQKSAVRQVPLLLQQSLTVAWMFLSSELKIEVAEYVLGDLALRFSRQYI